MTERELLDDGQDVVFSHQQIFDVVNFDSLACVAAEQDNIALVQLAFRTGAVIQQFATANCGDGATGRLFASRIWQDDSAGGGFFAIDTFDDNSLAHWLQA